MNSAWRSHIDQPDPGRKILNLFQDGSGAELLFVLDDGNFVSANGEERTKEQCPLFLWCYLPAGYEFWCEIRSENTWFLSDPDSLNLSSNYPPNERQ